MQVAVTQIVPYKDRLSGSGTFIFQYYEMWLQSGASATAMTSHNHNIVSWGSLRQIWPGTDTDKKTHIKRFQACRVRESGETTRFAHHHVNLGQFTTTYIYKQTSTRGSRELLRIAI